ncbi:Uncharacterized protein FWK35_00001336 [Aphis craccivora]|uniref:Uncharacterized protein n=1 Tax=Aphis craccivora TaxID=307492 RepID=A0A6G0ZH81_APHCR|nr:Uncharacterized protein FWK35_00001336 [Aphis craccivora]
MSGGSREAGKPVLFKIYNQIGRQNQLAPSWEFLGVCLGAVESIIPRFNDQILSHCITYFCVHNYYLKIGGYDDITNKKSNIRYQLILKSILNEVMNCFFLCVLCLCITSRNNAPISNFGDGHGFDGKINILEVKSKHFPTVFKKIEKNKKKNDGKTGNITQNQFSTKSIFSYGCNSKTNRCKYLKFSPNVYVSVIYIQLNVQKILTIFETQKFSIFKGFFFEFKFLRNCQNHENLQYKSLNIDKNLSNSWIFANYFVVAKSLKFNTSIIFKITLQRKLSTAELRK